MVEAVLAAPQEPHSRMARPAVPEEIDQKHFFGVRHE
jgi:hypothetical protein